LKFADREIYILTTLERIIIAFVSLIMLILSVIAIFLVEKSDNATIKPQPQSAACVIFAKIGD